MGLMRSWVEIEKYLKYELEIEASDWYRYYSIHGNRKKKKKSAANGRGYKTGLEAWDGTEENTEA